MDYDVGAAGGIETVANQTRDQYAQARVSVGGVRADAVLAEPRDPLLLLSRHARLVRPGVAHQGRHFSRQVVGGASFGAQLFRAVRTHVPLLDLAVPRRDKRSAIRRSPFRLFRALHLRLLFSSRRRLAKILYAADQERTHF